MASNQTSTVSELPPETIDFAHHMFDAACKGDTELLLAAEYVVANATGAPPSAGSSAQQQLQQQQQGGPPLSDSVSGPTQMLCTLWRTYGPAIIAGDTTLLQRQGRGFPAAPSASGSTSSCSDASPRGYDVDVDCPKSFVQSRTSSAGSASGLRGRIGSSVNSSVNISPDGRFEEVEVPSDAESERTGGALPPSAPRRSSGWFGGWAAGAAGAPGAAHEKAD